MRRGVATRLHRKSGSPSRRTTRCKTVEVFPAVKSDDVKMLPYVHRSHIASKCAAASFAPVPPPLRFCTVRCGVNPQRHEGHPPVSAIQHCNRSSSPCRPSSDSTRCKVLRSRRVGVAQHGVVTCKNGLL